MKTTFLALALLVPSLTLADFSLSVRIGPPALPVYAQPACPGDGYMWTPGYWAYGPYGYYWVPGVWVMPPRPGVLWTPGYWGLVGGIYGWHPGYWGPHVGFYGGVNYGYGYHGAGFVGGAWSGNVFRYNTAVTNVNTTVVKNVYVNKTVVNNTTIVNNRASFNGPGGVTAQPSREQQSFAREQHFQATPNQLAHQQTASRDRTQLASVNRGTPHTAAMDSVNGRRFNQQGRIANGIASGQVTPGEGKRLEGREAAIHHEVHADRAANGGRLTPNERAHVEHQQNKTSREIHEDKHNERHAPR